MSSVQRFIRQIPAETTYYNAANVISGSTLNAYELVAAGTMTIAASTGLQAAVVAAVDGAGGVSKVVLRDMGKTVRAALASDSSKVGHFRQVQLLAPKSAVLANSNFGIVAGAGYMTFYVPTVVMGSSADAARSVLHNANGQL
jgi:hypothetical protein